MILSIVCLAWILLFGYRVLHYAFSHRPGRRRCRGRRRRAPDIAAAPSTGLRPKKPAWVRCRVLELKERHDLSHRKLADLFNQLDLADTGVCVGRTWVRELLIKETHAALHRQRKLKHRPPAPIPNNKLWGVDTTTVTDGQGTQHIVLGAINHGSQLNLMLRYVRRFNRWTFLGCLMLAIGEFGRPDAIKTDNHPVFRSGTVKRVLHWCGIGLRHSRPARPWENGYIERMFGTFKRSISGYPILDAIHLRNALPAFQFWYNVTRAHQHLHGRMPQQAWLGIDPMKAAPRAWQDFSAWGGRLRGMVLRH